MCGQCEPGRTVADRPRADRPITQLPNLPKRKDTHPLRRRRRGWDRRGGVGGLSPTREGPGPRPCCRRCRRRCRLPLLLLLLLLPPLAGRGAVVRVELDGGGPEPRLVVTAVVHGDCRAVRVVPVPVSGGATPAPLPALWRAWAARRRFQSARRVWGCGWVQREEGGDRPLGSFPPPPCCLLCGARGVVRGCGSGGRWVSCC